jgi:hypothetical protein
LAAACPEGCCERCWNRAKSSLAPIPFLVTVRRNISPDQNPAISQGLQGDLLGRLLALEKVRDGNTGDAYGSVGHGVGGAAPTYATPLQGFAVVPKKPIRFLARCPVD